LAAVKFTDKYGYPDNGYPDMQTLCMGVLCTYVKLSTDLQILGCELHENAFGGRAPPGPTGCSYSAALPPGPLAVIRRREGRGRKGLGIGRRKGRMEGKEVVGGPNRRPTNPRWRTAAILKKTVKSLYISATV